MTPSLLFEILQSLALNKASHLKQHRLDPGLLLPKSHYSEEKGKITVPPSHYDHR
jgi:hypothetical protein